MICNTGRILSHLSHYLTLSNSVTLVIFCHTCQVFSNLPPFLTHVLFSHTHHVLLALVTFCHTCHFLPNLCYFTLVTFCHSCHLFSHFSISSHLSSFVTYVMFYHI